MSLDFEITCKQNKQVLHEFNITHNVSPVWSHVGAYTALYESEGKTVKEVLPALRKALHSFCNEITDMNHLTPKNGWGSVKGALAWLEQVVNALRDSDPDDVIRVSR